MFYIQFLKPFSILEIFFQNIHFLTPLTLLFLKKTPKFWLLLKIFWGGMLHMFSIQFLKPFSILDTFFQNFNFLTPLTPFSWKKLNFDLFWKSCLGTCGTCLVYNFQSPFRFWNNFFKIFIFWHPKPSFLKTLKILTFFENLLWGLVAHV